MGCRYLGSVGSLFDLNCILYNFSYEVFFLFGSLSVEQQLTNMPSGHVPNYVNPPSRKGELIRTAIGTDSAAIIVLILRLYTRKVLLSARLRPDDWIIIFANVRNLKVTVKKVFLILF